MTWTRSENPILATLQDLVAIDSVNPALPGGQQGEADMVAYLSTFFSALNIPFELSEVLPGRSNFIARFEGENPERQLLFECHMDTASAEVMTIPPFEPHIRDGRLYGRGSCDTKAGGAAMIHAIKRLRESGIKPPCTILYAGTIDEEAFFAGTNHLAEHLAAEAAVISEPTDLAVVRAHKGAVRFHLTVNGKAAHSAKPHLGVNAITKMAQLIARIEKEISPQYAAQSYPLLGSPTFNVGTIVGGAQVNFVPDQCQIAIDCRLIPGQTPEGVVQVFEEVIARAKAEDSALDAVVENPFFVCAALGTNEDAPIVINAANACSEVLDEATIAGVPYATDGSPFSAKGVPTIVLGPGSIDQAHGAIEWVDCQQVVQAVDIYQQIMLSPV